MGNRAQKSALAKEPLNRLRLVPSVPLLPNIPPLLQFV